MINISITGKKIRRWSIEIIILLAIIYAVSLFQTKDHVNKGKIIQDFTLFDLKSQKHEIKTNNKKKLLYFWAPWCSICKINFSNIDNIYRKYQNQSQKFQIVSIALSYQTQNELENFSQRKKITIPILLGNNEISSLFNITAFPTIYYLDENNKVVNSLSGYTTEIGMWLRL